jgi:hypothetical protein
LIEQIYLLADSEDHGYNTFSLGAIEINYLDKRNPVIAVAKKDVIILCT